MSVHFTCICGAFIHEADHPTWDAYRTARTAHAETCPLRGDGEVSRAFKHPRPEEVGEARPAAGQVLAPMSRARLAWLWACVVAVALLAACWSWALTRT